MSYLFALIAPDSCLAKISWFNQYSVIAIACFIRVVILCYSYNVAVCFFPFLNLFFFLSFTLFSFFFFFSSSPLFACFCLLLLLLMVIYNYGQGNCVHYLRSYNWTIRQCYLHGITRKDLLRLVIRITVSLWRQWSITAWMRLIKATIWCLPAAVMNRTDQWGYIYHSRKKNESASPL